MSDQHQFAHSRTSEAEWTSGLRKMFDYRDLGVKTATNGDFVVQFPTNDSSNAILRIGNA